MMRTPALKAPGTELDAEQRDGGRRSSLRVLLAADGSASARMAEEWIVRLRWASLPLVDVLCVARPQRLVPGLALQTYRPAVRSAVGELGQADLMTALRLANTVSERLQSERFRTRAWARLGDPASEINVMMRTERPDLLVIGYEGRRGRFSPPDLASLVIERVDAAILVVRAGEQGEGSIPKCVGVVPDADGSNEHLAWPSTAGWLAETAVIRIAPSIPSEMFAEHRPDLVVVGRHAKSSAVDTIHNVLESAAAVLVPPRPPRYDPTQELGA